MKVKIKEIQPVIKGYRRFEIPLFFDLLDDKYYWLKKWRVHNYLNQNMDSVFQAVVE